jgi:hypothetical protein
MEKSIILKLVVLAGALSFIYGCGPGGGSSVSLFGTGGETVSIASVVPDESNNESSGESKTLVNPEPASVLLLGGGLAAAAFFARRKK